MELSAGTPRAIPPPGTPEPERARSSRFTAERLIRYIFGFAALALGIWLLWYFSGLVFYLLIGIVLAYLLSPLVDRMQGIGIGRIPAILLVFVLALGSISVLLTYLIPFVGRQISGISQLFSPELLAQLASAIETYSGGLIEAETVTAAISRTISALFQDDQLSRTFDSLVDLFTNLVYALLVIPFVTFFFLKDGNRIRHNLLWFVPNRYFEITIALVEKIEVHVGRYFRALFLQCLYVATTASLLLTIIGLDYALAVGVFAGLANTIPYLGPLMGFIAGTVVSVAQTGDTSMVLGVLVAMVITQVTDNVLYQPLIFARAARTHPLIILFVVLIGAQLAGIVGMFLAIPLTATARVAVSQILWSIRNYRILRTP